MTPILEHVQGLTRIFGLTVRTTGVLGYTDDGMGEKAERAFPGWATLPGEQDLADGRVWHLFFGWVLTLAIVVYVIAGAIRKDLRELILRPSDLPKLLPMQLYYLRLRKEPPPHGTYNPLQKAAYTVVLFVFIPLIIVTGLALSPGVDAIAGPLTAVLGGRQFARLWHFTLMVAFDRLLPDPHGVGVRNRGLEQHPLDDHGLVHAGRTRRGRSVKRRLFIASSLGALGLSGCTSRVKDALTQGPFHNVLETAEGWNHAVIGTRGSARLYTDADIDRNFRTNGLDTPSDATYTGLAKDGWSRYKLVVDGLADHPQALSLAALRAMPLQTQITRHDCVEGWSAIGKWRGVRLADVLAAAGPKPGARFAIFSCFDRDDQGTHVLRIARSRPSRAPPNAAGARPQRRPNRQRSRRPRSPAHPHATRLQEREMGAADRTCIDLRRRRQW